MKRTILYLTLLNLCFSCNKSPKTQIGKPLTDSISIFEIYLQDSVAVDHFSDFLRDTLKLPVEWEPFDFFGDGVVYDAAFYLGNTTLELLAVNPPDTNIKETARYNRILFRSESIDSTSTELNKMDFQHQPPFEFEIASKRAELIIGRQINLDSMSNLSNINIAFWEYRNAGYNFIERTIKGETIEDLKPKLDNLMNSNPMGITGLKEVHLSVKQTVVNEWQKLLGPSKNCKWVLSEGPIISYTLAPGNIGADWVTLSVKDLKTAREFLTEKELLSTQQNRIAIDSSKIYGLQIYIEE